MLNANRMNGKPITSQSSLRGKQTKDALVMLIKTPEIIFRNYSLASQVGELLYQQESEKCKRKALHVVIVVVVFKSHSLKPSSREEKIERRRKNE